MADLIIWNSYNADAPDHPGLAAYTPIRPIGAHQLATWLAKFGYLVKVIDFCHMIPTKDLISITEKHITSNTIGIGCSSTFWNWNQSQLGIFEEPNWAIAARREVESKYPTFDWLLGGDNIRGRPFRFRWQKFAGYAEDSLLKYMDERSNNKTPRSPFDIKTLERFFGDGLGISPQEVLTLELGRGCQFKCAFCRYPLIDKKKGSYLRNFDLIETELRDNYFQYGTTRYFLVDETMNESEEKIEALATIAQRLPFKLEWIGYTRLDLIGARPASINLLRESGLKSTFMGIESFNPVASKAVGKYWIAKYGKDFLLKLRDEWRDDITWKLGLIIGLPGENEDSVNATHQWCIDNQMYSWDWRPLHIDPTFSSVWKSEFDKNWQNYGYSFPTHDELNWKNEFWTYDSATRKYQELQADARQYRKVAAWRVGEYATTQGRSFAEIMKWNVMDVDFNLLTLQAEEFVQKYINTQIALPVI